MIRINEHVHPADLEAAIQRFWELSGQKILRLAETHDPGCGSPVFTVDGAYTARGWTEWTRGFQFGSALLQFDATGDERFLTLGREGTLRHMQAHVTHFGVHDHGFNNVSTYGNLLRLMGDGRTPDSPAEGELCRLALCCSAAVQAYRWSQTADGGGYIYSFNGPHSLFADTIRSLRVLAIGHRLGHRLLVENDRPVSLLARLVQHARTTAGWNVYYGLGRDAYDIRGRVAHESIFNTNDGQYRCPSSQQGYSPFTTWTRGLAWIVLGYAEQLEFLDTLADAELDVLGGREDIQDMMLDAARATADYYIRFAAADGIPYWDTGAPGLHRLDGWEEHPADPFNDYEPVDSSAACIACQGLMRLGAYLEKQGETEGHLYMQAGLTALQTLLAEPYLSTDPHHQGLILHSVYHRPNGWDHIPPGRCIPCGESSMWGDYHAREATLYAGRLARRQPYLTFWGNTP
ncbi:MAG: glycosyl hydrolase [Lentisphaeria bacterium]|nr:glycosyl hydrolase [Lentisphaeria bacterium]